MIKYKRIGNTIIASWRNKLFQKDFNNTEGVLSALDIIGNIDEYDDDDVEQFKQLFQAEKTSSEKQLELEFEKKKEESKKLEDILDFMKEVKANGDNIFEVVENSLYVKGINISVPERLVREIIKARELNGSERLSALINFWSLCALNSDPRARHDLFKFIDNHNLTVTPSGNFVAYRTVVDKQVENKELEAFITQQYLKIRRWKKAPSNYTVGYNSDGDMKIVTNASELEETLGNLDELYNNISEVTGNVYTDNHTRSMTIKIGVPVEVDRATIDPDPKHSCSTGLHVGNLEFMKNNMGYFGKTGLVCLVNPKDVTSVPEYDHGKMRTCRYLPVAIAELDEDGYIVPVDIDVFDIELAQNTQEELQAMSKLSSTELEEYKKHEFIAPEVDFNTVNNILNKVIISVEEANKKIKNRVVKI